LFRWPQARHQPTSPSPTSHHAQVILASDAGQSYHFQLLEEQRDQLGRLESQIKEQQKEEQSRQQQDPSLCEQQHEDDQRQLSLERTDQDK
jgi:hypothetical protein